MLVPGRTYEFMNGMTLLYATYWTYDRWMFALDKYDAFF